MSQTEFYRYTGKSTVSIEIEVEWEALVPVSADADAARRITRTAAINSAASRDDAFDLDLDDAKVTHLGFKREGRVKIVESSEAP